MLRYVVLHHTGIDNPHYDLMYEFRPGSMLTTRRIPHWPPEAHDQLTPLPKHRREYLDYEGPVSGNRGQVRRVASGTCEVEVDSEQSCLVKLDTGLQIRIARSWWD